ncbi:hypothetical protein ACTFIZ_007979 [Dictyostelium cf. discoideum]
MSTTVNNNEASSSSTSASNNNEINGGSNRDYSTFQSHVKSIIGTQNSGTAELLMKSWEQSTLKVYNSSYTRFLNFCTLNSLDPSNITLGGTNDTPRLTL